MPLLAALLGAIFTKMVDFLITFIGKKFAVNAAVIAAYLALIVGFTLALNAALSVLGTLNPPQFLITAFAFLPSNTDTCIAIIMSTRLIAAAFVAKSKALKLIV